MINLFLLTVLVLGLQTQVMIKPPLTLPSQTLGAPGVDYVNGPSVVGSPITTPKVFGTVRVLIVAVDFPDVQHTKSIDDLTNAFFGSGLSLSSFYSDVSYDQFIVTGKVFGWITAKYELAHYGADIAGVDVQDSIYTPGTLQLILETQKTITGLVHFSDYEYYMVVHAGSGEETNVANPSLIWSSTFPDLSSYAGSMYPSAAIVPETEDRGITTLGVYAHEFGHLIGLPDLYKGHTNIDITHFDLMDIGAYNGDPRGSTPSELSSWCRNKIGWLSDSSITTITPGTSTIIQLAPLELAPVTGNSAIKVPVSASEYYMLEVREKIGYDNSLPDHGLVAYDIKEGDGTGANQHVTFNTIRIGTGTIALHYSGRYAVGKLAVKVLAVYPNGTYLIGLGDSSMLPTYGIINLTVAFTPTANSMTITVDGRTYTTDATGKIVVVSVTPTNSTTFNISTPNIFPCTTDTRLKFVNWSNGETSSTLSITTTSDVTVTAQYKTQYYVSVTSSYTNAVGTGWYDNGGTATLSVPTKLDALTPGTRYLFKDWTGDYTGTNNTATVTVTKPLKITAVWTTQFYLTVNSNGHAPVTGEGWYDQDSQATFTLTPPQPEDGVWYTFHGWTGDYTGRDITGTITMAKPLNVEVAWTVLNKMSFVFTIQDTTTPTAPSRVNLIVLRASNGTEIQVNRDLISSGVWLEKGAYRILKVPILNTDSAYANQTFTTRPNGSINIQLALFNLTFDIRDSIFGTPISGAQVNATLPDGTTEILKTENGKATISQLPDAVYPFTVSMNGAYPAKGSATLKTQNSFVSVKLTQTSSITIVAGSIIAPILAAAFLIIQQHKQKQRRARRSHRKSRVREILEGGAALETSNTETFPPQEQTPTKPKNLNVSESKETQQHKRKHRRVSRSRRMAGVREILEAGATEPLNTETLPAQEQPPSKSENLDASETEKKQQNDEALRLPL